MGKKALIGSLLIASMMSINNPYSSAYWKNIDKDNGSPIYIPKRHKFKKKNKR